MNELLHLLSKRIVICDTLLLLQVNIVDCNLTATMLQWRRQGGARGAIAPLFADLVDDFSYYSHRVVTMLATWLI